MTRADNLVIVGRLVLVTKTKVQPKSNCDGLEGLFGNDYDCGNDQLW